MTSWSSFKSIFEFFEEKLSELKTENEHSISPDEEEIKDDETDADNGIKNGENLKTDEIEGNETNDDGTKNGKKLKIDENETEETTETKEPEEQPLERFQTV